MKKINYHIQYSSYFKREFKKIGRVDNKLVGKVVKAIEQISMDPFYGSLSTHCVNISGLGRVYSSRVTGDIRIIWTFEDDKIVLLHRLGGHSGSSNVYK